MALQRVAVVVALVAALAAVVALAGVDAAPHSAAVVMSVLPDGTKKWSVRDIRRRARNFGAAVARGGRATGVNKAPPAVPAQGTWDDQIETTGWSYLTVDTTPGPSGQFTDRDQAYAAGYLEAYLSWPRIYQVAVNGGSTNYTASCPAVVQQFLTANRAWMEQQIAANPSDVYWHQIDLIWTQLHGLVDGYNAYAQAPQAQPLTFWDLWSLSGGDDMWELIGALTSVDGGQTDLTNDHDHCSAIIKVTPGNADLLITHTSWEGLGNMLRTFKRYNFPWTTTGLPGAPTVPATSIVFASYPGVLFSGDDYYQTSQQLVVQETTIHTFNLQSLYNEYIRPTTVMDWVRNMLANRLATGGADWSQLFGRYNSGTYNNAFMVLDYKRWVAGQPVADDLLWLAEQLPGTVTAGDVSGVLRAQTYYASYNVAYFPVTFNLSGTAEMVAQYGDYYSYDRTARANIFRRDHSGVVDVPSLQRLIRYNDFKNDPLSACPCDPPYTSLFSISTRQDLDDPSGQYQFAFEGFRNHVGIDAKVTSSALMADDLACWAQSGPTHDQQPVFRWSTSRLRDNVTHVGMPDAYDFDWVRVAL